MISSTAATGLSFWSKNTLFRPPIAASKDEIGEVTITAPRVPPSTMTAAEICRISVIFPPSHMSPPTIAPRAITKPAKLAISGDELLRDDLGGAAGAAAAAGLSAMGRVLGF